MFVRSALLAVGLFSASAIGQSPRPDIRWLWGGHIPSIPSVAYSPDGTMLASGGHFSDSTIKLWRVSDGAMIRTLPGATTAPFLFGPMVPIIFYPDGRTISGVGEGNGPAFWNVADGQLTNVLNNDATEIAVNPAGTLLAMGTRSKTVKLLRASDGLPVRTLTGLPNSVSSVAFSPDGATVAGTDITGRLRTWRVSDGLPQLDLQAHNNDISAVRYSPDGSRIATGSNDQTIRLWNSGTGALAGTLTGHTNAIASLAFSPNGALLASGSWDRTVRLWNMPSGSPAGTLTLSQQALCVTFHPSSSRLAVAADFQLLEFDVATRSQIRSFLNATQALTSALFTSDSSRLIAAGYDGRINVWDVLGGSRIRTILATAGVQSMAITRDGANLGVGTNDRGMRMYRLSDGSLLRAFDPGTFTYSLAFSPDGQTLASGHLDDVVRLWNTTDGSLRATLSGHTDQPNGLAYTPDGSLILSASQDGSVRVWTAQGAFVRSLTGGGSQLYSLAISPTGEFALGGGGVGEVTLWRISTGQRLYSIQTGTGRVSAIAFTPNGLAFYCKGPNGRLEVRIVTDGALLETYSRETGSSVGVFNGLTGVSVSPDGKWLGYARDDATAVLAHNALIAAPTALTQVRGEGLEGSVQSMALSDDVPYLMRNLPVRRVEPPVQVHIVGRTALPNPTRLHFVLEAGVDLEGLSQEVWMRNVQTGIFELVDQRPATLQDSVVRVDLAAGFARFIGSSGEVQALLKWVPVGTVARRTWSVRVDQAVWSAGL